MKFFVPLALVASAYAAVAADQSDNTAGLAGSSNWDWCGEKAFSKCFSTDDCVKDADCKDKSKGQLKLIQCGSFWYPNDCYTYY